MFTKATKKAAKARIAISAPSGGGKTFTALTIASGLGGKIAVIDTERGSASKYADRFSFDVCEPEEFSPASYVQAIKAAEAAGYDVLVIDSLTHAWSGKGGALEQVDNAAARSQGNKFAAWRHVTPMHNALVDAMVSSKCHVIATMRSKTEWVIDEDDRGRKVPRKIGMAPVQRDGMEYEFDIFGEMDQENTLIITKSRCEALSGAVIKKPGQEFAGTIKSWLEDGAAVEKVVAEAPAPKAAPAKKPPVKPAGEQIKAAKTPQLLVSMVNQWHNQKPIGDDPAWWERVIKATEDKYNDSGWGPPDSDELVDLITSLKSGLETCRQGAEAF